MYDSIEKFEDLLLTAQQLWKTKKVAEASKAFKKAVDYTIEVLEDEEDFEYYLSRLSGAIYRAVKEQKQYRQYRYLIEYLEQLVRVNEMLDDSFQLSQSLLDLGRNLVLVERFQEAEECYERALSITGSRDPKQLVYLSNLFVELHSRQPEIRNLAKVRNIFNLVNNTAQRLREATWFKAKLYRNIAYLFKEEDPEFAIFQAEIAAKTYHKLSEWLYSRRERDYKQINNAIVEAFRMAKFSGNTHLIILSLKDYLKIVARARPPYQLREYIEEFNKFWSDSEIFNEYKPELIELSEIIADLEYKKFQNLPRAIELYKKAIQFSQESKSFSKQTLLLCALSDVNRVAGELEESLKLLIEAENLAETLDDQNRKANCTKKIAHVYRNFGDYTAAARKYEKALSLNLKDENLRSECLTGLSHIYSLRDGNYEKALELRKQAMKFSRKRIGYKMILSATLGMLLRFNAFKEAKSAIYELKELERTLTDKSVNFNMRGLYSLRLGRYSDANQFLSKSLEFGSQLDEQGYGKKWRLFPQESLISCLISEGKIDEAEVLAKDALATSLEPPIHYNGVILNHRQLSSIAMHKGEFHTGLEHLHQALEFVDERRLHYRKPGIHEMTAILQYRSGKLDEAHHSLLEAISIYNELSNPYFKIKHAKLLSRLGNHTQAGGLFYEASKASQYHPIKSFLKILSLYELSFEKKGSSEEISYLKEAVGICRGINGNTEEKEVSSTFKFWERILEIRVTGLTLLNDYSGILDLRKKISDILATEIFLSQMEKRIIERNIQIAEVISKILSENRFPNPSETSDIMDLIREIADIDPLEYSNKVRLFKSNVEDRFTEENVEYFIREFLFSPPSKRFPMCPQHYFVYTDENYD